MSQHRIPSRDELNAVREGAYARRNGVEFDACLYEGALAQAWQAGWRRPAMYLGEDPSDVC